LSSTRHEHDAARGQHAVHHQRRGAHRHDATGSSGGHDHGVGYGHEVAADADHRWLSGALALIVLFMVAEVVVGVIAHSLALLSDAAHMLTDAASIVLANGITLLVLSAWLTYEAVRRLLRPPAVVGGLVLITALVGIVVNLAATWFLSRANRQSLNVQGAFQHILTDLFGFIATAIAGALVLATGFTRADAIASLVVVMLMLRAGVSLVRASGRIFLEAAPADADPDEVGDRMASVSGIAEIHDLHLWEITSGQAALSAHVLVRPGLDCHRIRRRLETVLRGEYGITHTTLQVDHLTQARGEELLQISEPDTAERNRGRDHDEQVHGPTHRSGPHPH
jgi:cobalt-zinc-cadmium efflux system protein